MMIFFLNKHIFCDWPPIHSPPPPHPLHITLHRHLQHHHARHIHNHHHHLRYTPSGAADPSSHVCAPVTETNEYLTLVYSTYYKQFMTVFGDGDCSTISFKLSRDLVNWGPSTVIRALLFHLAMRFNKNESHCTVNLGCTCFVVVATVKLLTTACDRC